MTDRRKKQRKAKTPKRIYFVVSDYEEERLGLIFDTLKGARMERDDKNGLPTYEDDHRVVCYVREDA